MDINFEKYQVLKSDDISRYCTEEQKQNLLEIVETIMDGRFDDGKRMSNQYYVVNVDEVWADEIKQVIEEHTN